MGEVIFFLVALELISFGLRPFIVKNSGKIMTTFAGYEFTVEKTFYTVDKSIALQLWCEDGPLGTATVNLAEQGLVPDINCCFIKDCYENTGILDALVAAQIVEPIEVIGEGIILAKVLI